MQKSDAEFSALKCLNRFTFTVLRITEYNLAFSFIHNQNC